MSIHSINHVQLTFDVDRRDQVHELQVTPIPTTTEGPSTVGSGAVWGFARSVGARLLPWLVPVALVVFWQVEARRENWAATCAITPDAFCFDS